MVATMTLWNGKCMVLIGLLKKCILAHSRKKYHLVALFIEICVKSIQLHEKKWICMHGLKQLGFDYSVIKWNIIWKSAIIIVQSVQAVDCSSLPLKCLQAKAMCHEILMYWPEQCTAGYEKVGV